MTIHQALDRIDLLRPNKVAMTQKVAWLAELDGLITREILASHVPEVVSIRIEDRILPEGTEIEIPPEEDAWHHSHDKEIIVPKAIAGVHPHYDIEGNNQLYRVMADGRLHMLPAPVIHAIFNSITIKHLGYIKETKALSGEDVKLERLFTYVDAPDFLGYTMDTDFSTELIAPFPYDEIYTHYLALQCDLVNQELGKYNNDKTLFNNAYDTLSDYWTRTHMPIQKTRELRL